MAIQIVREKISKKELREIADKQFGDVVKAVVDIRQGIMAVGGELHADEEVVLTEQEQSQREYTWGINIYTQKSGDEFIAFDSMINIKPAFGNRSRTVENADIQEKIKGIVKKLMSE